MPLQDVLSQINDAYSKGESFDLDMSNASAKDVVSVSDYIKKLTGKEVFKPLADAHRAKEPISLEFPSKIPQIKPTDVPKMPEFTPEEIQQAKPAIPNDINYNPSTIQKIAKGATGLLPAAGMIAGGMAVAPLVAAQAAIAPVTGGASALTGLLTAAGGAGTGAIIGASAEQLANRALGIKSPDTAGEAISGITKAGLEGATLEFGTGAATIALKGLAKPFAATIKENAPAISRIADKLGVKLTPADINTNPWLQRFETLMDNTWLGASNLNDARKAQTEAIRTAKLGLEKKYGTRLSTEQTGEQVAQRASDILASKQAGIVETGKKLSEKYGTKLNTEDVYKTVTNSIIEKSQAENALIKKIYAKRDLLIDTQKEMPIKHTLSASNAIQSTEQKAIIKGDPDLLSITSSFSNATPGGMTPYKRPTFETISDAITKINDKIVQENALAMQSGLKGAAGQSTQKGRLLVQIKQGLQQDLDNFLRTQPKEARALNTLAKQKYSEFAQTFKSDEIRDLADKDPMSIVKFIDTGRIKEFDMIKRAIGKKGIEPIQQRFFQNIIEKAVPQEGELQAKAIDSILQGYKPEILGRIFSKQQISDLSKLSKQIKGIPEDLQKISAKDPMQMVKYLINPGRTQEFDSAVKILGKTGITPLQKQFFQNIIDEAIPAQGPLNIGAIDKVMGLYRQRINRVMDPSAVKELKDISLLVNNLSTKGEQQKITNLAHIIGIATGASWKVAGLPTAIAGTLSPYALSKFYTSSMGRKLLIEGLTLKPGQQAIAKYSAKVAQFAAMYGLTENAQK